jgi:hypothetical protein
LKCGRDRRDYAGERRRDAAAGVFHLRPLW